MPVLAKIFQFKESTNTITKTLDLVDGSTAFIPESSFSFPKTTLEYKAAEFRYSDISFSIFGVSELYFTDYTEDYTYIVEIQDQVGLWDDAANDIIFVGVLNKNIQYDDLTQLTKVSAYSIDKILERSEDVSARGNWKSYLVAPIILTSEGRDVQSGSFGRDSDTLFEEQIKIPVPVSTTDQSTIESTYLTKGSVIAIKKSYDFGSVEYRAVVNSYVKTTPYRPGSYSAGIYNINTDLFNIGVLEYLPETNIFYIPGGNLTKTIEIPAGSYYGKLPDITGGLWTIYIERTTDPGKFITKSYRIEKAEARRFDFQDGNGEVDSIILNLDRSIEDLKYLQNAYDSDAVKWTLHPYISIDSGTEINLWSDKAYGNMGLSLDNFTAVDLLKGLFSSAYVINKLFNNSVTINGNPINIDRRVNFPVSLKESLKKIQLSCELLLKYTWGARMANGLRELQIIGYTRDYISNTTPVSVGVPLTWVEQKSPKNPTVVVKGHGIINAISNSKESFGWYSEDASGVTNATIFTQKIPSGSNVIKVSSDFILPFGDTFFKGDLNSIFKNDPKLSGIAYRYFVFYKNFGREGNCVLDGSDTSYIGQKITTASPHSKTAIVVGETIDKQKDRTSLSLLVGAYSAGTNNPPVARIIGKTQGVITGAKVSLNLSGRESYDPNGDTLSFQWKIGNIMLNPKFISDVSGWASFGDCALSHDPTNGVTGDGCAKCNVTTNILGYAGLQTNSTDLTNGGETPTIKIGDKLKFIVSVKGDTASNGKSVKINVQTRDSVNAIIEQSQLTFALTTSYQTKEIELTVSNITDLQYVRMQVNKTGTWLNDGTENYYIDDIDLQFTDSAETGMYASSYNLSDGNDIILEVSDGTLTAETKLSVTGISPFGKTGTSPGSPTITADYQSSTDTTETIRVTATKQSAMCLILWREIENGAIIARNDDWVGDANEPAGTIDEKQTDFVITRPLDEFGTRNSVKYLEVVGVNLNTWEVSNTLLIPIHKNLKPQLIYAASYFVNATDIKIDWVADNDTASINVEIYKRTKGLADVLVKSSTGVSGSPYTGSLLSTDTGTDIDYYYIKITPVKADASLGSIKEYILPNPHKTLLPVIDSWQNAGYGYIKITINDSYYFDTANIAWRLKSGGDVIDTDAWTTGSWYATTSTTWTQRVLLAKKHTSEIQLKTPTINGSEILISRKFDFDEDPEIIEKSAYIGGETGPRQSIYLDILCDEDSDGFDVKVDSGDTSTVPTTWTSVSGADKKQYLLTSTARLGRTYTVWVRPKNSVSSVNGTESRVVVKNNFSFQDEPQYVWTIGTSGISYADLDLKFKLDKTNKIKIEYADDATSSKTPTGTTTNSALINSDDVTLSITDLLRGTYDEKTQTDSPRYFHWRILDEDLNAITDWRVTKIPYKIDISVTVAGSRMGSSGAWYDEVTVQITNDYPDLTVTVEQESGLVTIVLDSPQKTPSGTPVSVGDTTEYKYTFTGKTYSTNYTTSTTYRIKIVTGVTWDEVFQELHSSTKMLVGV